MISRGPKNENDPESASASQEQRNHCGAGADESSQSVILLHGLGAIRLVMSRLALILRRSGYDVSNWGYRSTWGSIDSHAKAFQDRFGQALYGGIGRRLHIVAHSMGGIVARRVIADRRPVNLERMVMLGPPNSGSHVARRLAGPLGRVCRPLRELSDAPNSYVRRLEEPRDIEIGIIAAALDRVVKLDSTSLACQSDHIVLPGHHGMLPWRRDTANQVIHFLQSGRFDRRQLSTVCYNYS